MLPRRQMVRGRKLGRNEKALRAVQPNEGICAEYRFRLTALIERMHASVYRAITAAYRRNPPEMPAGADTGRAVGAGLAQDEIAGVSEPEIDRLRVLAEGGDATLPGAPGPTERLLERGLIRIIPVYRALAEGYERGDVVYELTEAGEEFVDLITTPAARLEAVIANMAARWQARFDEAAPKMADYFATAINARSKATLATILKQGGISVRFTMTPVMRDVIDATIAEQVGLIRTIPQRYLGEVEGLVMRSVQRGRDLGQLSSDLLERYAITKRRAALIARDQNNKATSTMVHARQADLGIREAIWMHSHAGKVPRWQHVEMNGKRYDITKGMWDKVERKWVFPGELINCRCTGRPVVLGFS